MVLLEVILIFIVVGTIIMAGIVDDEDEMSSGVVQTEGDDVKRDIDDDINEIY